jgi:hypothetical protein
MIFRQMDRKFPRFGRKVAAIRLHYTLKKLLHIAFACLGWAVCLLFFGLAANPPLQPPSEFSGPALFLHLELHDPFACDHLLFMNADGLGFLATFYELNTPANWASDLKSISVFQMADTCLRQLVHNELDLLAESPDTSKSPIWDAATGRIYRNGALLFDNYLRGNSRFWNVFAPIRQFTGLTVELACP